MFAIEVENLVKKYGDFPAVKGISFKVRRGEVFGFLGPNGAGKTTTIHVLTTLLKPTSGTAIVAGYDVVKKPKEVRKRIGIVFQDPSLDRELTAYENMYIHGRIYGYEGGWLKRRIWELLKFVELEKHANRVVKTFSSGMQRRLEIARALIHQPEILFLDEPTLGLDPHTRAHIWEYIKMMKKEYDTTIFLTTHYMDEAEMLCDRIAIIDHGKIIAIGTPEELKSIVGKEVVYLRLANNVKECIEADFIEDCKILPDGSMKLSVKDASKVLPEIFEIASRRGWRILEISYRKPTLNDVFLYLTGREIREEGEDRLSMARALVRRGIG